MKKKIALLMAAVMLFGVTVGATIAWLTDETENVVNTFTVGDVQIELDEEDVDFDTDTNSGDITTSGRDKANVYHLIPGKSYVKDPTVHTLEDNENAYLFVKVENGIADIEAPSVEGGYQNIEAQMIANGWVETDVENVWVYGATVDRVISATSVPAEQDKVVFSNFKIADTVLRGNKVNSDDSNKYIADYTAKDITIKAYAIQVEGIVSTDINGMLVALGLKASA